MSEELPNHACPKCKSLDIEVSWHDGDEPVEFWCVKCGHTWEE